MPRSHQKERAKVIAAYIRFLKKIGFRPDQSVKKSRKITFYISIWKQIPLTYIFQVFYIVSISRNAPIHFAIDAVIKFIDQITIK